MKLPMKLFAGHENIPYCDVVEVPKHGVINNDKKAICKASDWMNLLLNDWQIF